MTRNFVSLALIGATASLALIVHSSFAQNAADTRVAASERAALLAALRVNSEKDLGKPVVFVVKTLTVRNNVAFVATMPERAHGRQIDVRQTPIGRQGAAEETDGVHTEGLFYKRDGRWVLEHYSVGSTDVWYDNPDFCPRYASVLPSNTCKR